MTKRIVLGVAVLCSVLGMLSGVAATYADEPSRTTLGIAPDYTIVDDDGRNVTREDLVAGDSYTVSFRVTVDVDLPNVTLRLETPMEKAGGVYWSLDSDYAGVDTNTWQPGLPSIDFKAVAGEADFTVRGTIPDDYTKEVLSNGEMLHHVRTMSLVGLWVGADANPYNEILAEVTDQAIAEYGRVLADKEHLLGTATIASEYGVLAQALVFRAKTLFNDGYVQRASNLLNALPDTQSDFPTPPSDESSLPFIVIIVVLALVLVVVFFLFLRARSNSTFVRQQVDDEAGRLDVLLVRVSKIDKQLARDIEHVKEQLERIGGR